MADDPASDDLPPGFSRAVLTGAIAITAVALAVAVTTDHACLQLVEVFFPYPLIALAAAAPMAWIVARLRHAPARSRTGLLVPWSWVIARFALMLANTYLLLAWIVAALIGASLAKTLLEAALLAILARAIFFVAEQCTIDVRRAIRGPA